MSITPFKKGVLKNIIRKYMKKYFYIKPFKKQILDGIEIYSIDLKKKRTNVHNIIIELLTWLGIIAVVLMTLYSLQTLWIVIRYYYLTY